MSARSLTSKPLPNVPTHVISTLCPTATPLPVQVHALTAHVASLEETVECQRGALDESDACLSAAREAAQRSAASLETVVARGEVVQTELNALREFTGSATRELREELALLRAQVDGAERTAAELKEEATAAAAAAAAARASQTATAGEAAARAERAASQHAADREAIEALQERAAAAAVAAAEAEARADEAIEQARADALAEVSAARISAGEAEAGRRVDAGNSPMRRTEEGEMFSSCVVASDDARVRSLRQALDSIATKTREMAATAVRVGWASPEEECGSAVVPAAARRDSAAVAEEAASGETLGGEGAEDEVSRVLAVAVRVAADVETLREALTLAEENVSGSCLQLQNYTG